MAAGLGTLRLSSQAFWSMTPTELAAALCALPGGASVSPPTRRELDALMQRFPDSGA